jgi:hypothetical protein
MSTLRKWFLSLSVVTVAAGVAGTASFAAFSASSENPNNDYSAGTVLIGDNDAGATMVTLTGGDAGNSSSGCILVTYSGTLASTVRLYATTTGDIAPYITLKVTRGTDASPSFPSCTGFTPDGTDYLGQGNGVIYNGTLSSFPTTYAAGQVDPTSGSPAAWNTSEAHAYKLTVTLSSDPAGQGTSGTASFFWEARNQ